MRSHHKIAYLFLALAIFSRVSYGYNDDDDDDDEEAPDNSVKFRGIDPENLDLYLGKTFRCPGSDKEIPIEFVNDNYCDCPVVEGETVTDEPGTGACANNVFYCKDASLRDVRLKPSQINDGFCDCCDGSDEWDNEDAHCEYKCGNMAKELIDREREHLVDIRKYMREKKHLGDTAAKDLPKFVREYKNNKTKIANQEAKVKEYNQKEKDLIESMKKMEEQFAEKAKAKKETTTPNLDIDSMVENLKAEDEEYNKAKKEIETLKAEREDVRKRLAVAKAEFDPTVTEDVFGDDKCFFDLYGKNLTFDKGDFEYTVFFFKKATQRGVIEKEAISTGKWGGWDTDPVTGEPVMKYTKGRRCGDDGARRNTTVVFECAKDHTFDDVDISDPCNLVFKISSPCGCTKTVFKRLRHKLDLVSTLYRNRRAPTGAAGGSSHHSCNDDYCTI